MTTVIHYYGTETENENISESALRAIENTDVEIKLYDYNKFDVLVRFEDDDPKTFTLQIQNGEVSHELTYTCPNCGDVIYAFYADSVTYKTIVDLIKKILDHESHNCLATMELSAIRKHVLTSLNFAHSNDAHAVAESIYYLAEVIRRAWR